MSEGLCGKSLIDIFWYSDFIHICIFNFHVGYQTSKKTVSVKLKCACNNSSSFPYSRLEKASFALNIWKGNDQALMNENAVWALTNRGQIQDATCRKPSKQLFLS